ncbi:MAG: PAS domain S-box protein, partial [Desulfatirhabdiaceae bacterium]
MIRNTIIHLVWIMVFMTGHPCYGSDSKLQLSPEEQSWIDQQHTVRVRIGNAPPYMLTNGKIQGIAIDYLTHIFNLNKIKYQYVKDSDVTWPQALKYIEQHEIVDLVPTAKITEERKQHMLFTDEYLFAPWVIFTRSDSGFVSSIADLKGKTVSVEEGFVIHEKLKREYPEIKLKVVSAKLNNYAEIPVRDLSTGLVDAYIGNLFMTTYMIQSRGYTNIKAAAPTPFENHNQAMALRNDWPELARIINRTLAAMTPDEHAAIRNRWLSIRYEYGITTADVLKWIAGVAGVSLILIAFVMFWNRRLKAEVSFRKKIEADLRDSENLLNDVGTIAKIGGWEMDLVTRKSKWTRGTHEIIEIGMGEPIPGPDEYIHDYLPEYRARVNEAMTALIHEDKPMGFEARLQTAKGNIKWCRAMGRAIRHDGKCMKLYGTFQDITERKQSETEAKKRESLFEKIFNILPVGLWIADENGRLLRGNPAGIEIWGAEPHVSPSEYGVFKARRLPSGEEIATDDWALAQTVKTGMTVVDEMLEIDAFDGTKKIILNYTAPVLDDAGTIQAAIVVNHDITMRKRAEAAERQTETWHRTLIDTIPDLIWLKDLNGVYLSCNPTFERFFGARESEIIGKTDYDFVDKDLADFFREHDRKSIATGHPSINEERLTFADGGYQGLFETIKTPMFDADGNLVGVLGIARDITGRKTAEDALKENEQRYKQAENLGHVGNWEYDLVTEKFWGSDEAKRIYGFDPDSRKFTVDDVENCIPERERVHQALVDLIEKNVPYNLEFEIRPIFGPKTRIIKSIAEIMKDDSGTPIKVVGVIQD